MGYTIRRWMSSGGMLFDDSRTTKAAEDAVEEARRLAGIFSSVVNDDFERKVMMMDPGEVVKFRKPSIKLTINVRRTKKMKFGELKRVINRHAGRHDSIAVSIASEVTRSLRRNLRFWIISMTMRLTG